MSVESVQLPYRELKLSFNLSNLETIAYFQHLVQHVPADQLIHVAKNFATNVLRFRFFICHYTF
jgi:hypothetical protein